MMARSAVGTLLFVVVLFVAGPTWAQDEAPESPESDTDIEALEEVDDTGDEDAEDSQEVSAPDEDVADETGDDAEAVDDADDAETDDEQAEATEEADGTESADAIDEDVEPEVAEATPAEDVDSQATEITDADFEDPRGGMAYAPAYDDPETDVRVLGNLEEGDNWTLDIGGYIRTGFTYIQPDPDYELYGRNDGFVMSDARLTTRGQLDNGLGFVMSLDAGGRLVRTTPDSPVEELSMRMTDTYVYYAPFEFIEFNLGQFKAPFLAEDLVSSSDLLFIHRSVANRGVQDVEGFNVDGLSEDRQVGLQARGTVPIIDLDGPEGDEQPLAVSYAAAVANGNGPNRSLNENSRLASYGRLVAHWGNVVGVGASVFDNDRTFGDPPNQTDQEFRGWTADIHADLFGASLLASYTSRTEQAPDLPQNEAVTALGYQLQIAYEEPFLGIQPAYRFAYYDPSDDFGDDVESDFFEDDALTYHTFGLNFNARDYPVRLMANYTLKLEEGARQLDNDQLDLLLQLQW